MKLASFQRDWLSGLLLIALPTSALILTIALIGMVINDWESSTDCVGACDRDDDLQLALDAAEVAAYGFGLLLILAVARWLVLAVGAGRAARTR